MALENLVLCAGSFNRSLIKSQTRSGSRHVPVLPALTAPFPSAEEATRPIRPSLRQALAAPFSRTSLQSASSSSILQNSTSLRCGSWASLWAGWFAAQYQVSQSIPNARQRHPHLFAKNARTCTKAGVLRTERQWEVGHGGSCIRDIAAGVVSFGFSYACGGYPRKYLPRYLN